MGQNWAEHMRFARWLCAWCCDCVEEVLAASAHCKLQLFLLRNESLQHQTPDMVASGLNTVLCRRCA